MKLDLSDLEEVKRAAEKIGNFGKVTLQINDGVLLDIITETRERIQDSKKVKNG